MVWMGDAPPVAWRVSLLVDRSLSVQPASVQGGLDDLVVERLVDSSVFFALLLFGVELLWLGLPVFVLGDGVAAAEVDGAVVAIVSEGVALLLLLRVSHRGVDEEPV